jgi:3'-phosphoadenosine 5'-phosphosulfate sulfotransferase (PAPS reductase)/FAD synthetase
MKADRPPMTVLSCGAGVQSSTLVWMAVEGIEHYDHIIFADPGWEHPDTYDNVRVLKWACEDAGVPFHTVSNGNIHTDTLSVCRGVIPPGLKNINRIPQMPFFKHTDEIGTPRGQMRRRCTSEYKVVPVKRLVRSLKDAGGFKRVVQSYGISFDETRRMRESDVKYITNRYPLVDMKMTREDCLTWLREHNRPVPVRSSCIVCPFKSDDEWLRMRAYDDDLWSEAVEFDKAIRKGLPFLPPDTLAYVHRSCVPLDEVKFKPDMNRDLFTGECRGFCGT